MLLDVSRPPSPVWYSSFQEEITLHMLLNNYFIKRLHHYTLVYNTCQFGQGYTPRAKCCCKYTFSIWRRFKIRVVKRSSVQTHIIYSSWNIWFCEWNLMVPCGDLRPNRTLIIMNVGPVCVDSIKCRPRVIGWVSMSWVLHETCIRLFQLVLLLFDIFIYAIIHTPTGCHCSCDKCCVLSWALKSDDSYSLFW